jgi:prefoldin subunit 5
VSIGANVVVEKSKEDAEQMLSDMRDPRKLLASGSKKKG